jgi:putative transposase
VVVISARVGDLGVRGGEPVQIISRLVNSLKGVSSRRMRQEYPDLVRHYWRAQRLWSGSYFAGSAGGAPLSIVKHYIEQQNRPV